MITLKENEITVQDYLAIRAKVKWKRLLDEQAKLALQNSIYAVGIYNDDELIAMGRLVGDGAVICYVQDLIVDPNYQKQGLGSKVLNALIAYAESLRQEHSEMMLCLMCAKGRESFYERHHFIARPTDMLGPGMIQYINDGK